MSCNEDTVIVQSGDKIGQLKSIIQDSIKSGKIVYVLFFHPGCGHCQAFAPVFLSYRKDCEAKSRKGKNKAVMIMVNHTTAPEVFAKLGITSYPRTHVYTEDVNKPTRVIMGANEQELEEVMKWSGLSSSFE